MALLTRRTALNAALAAGGGTLIGTLAGRKLAQAEPEMRPLTDIAPVTPPRPLPPVSFKTLDGGTKTLADFAGRPIVLNVWATWCVPCVAELPELDKLAAVNPDIAVLAVSADRTGAAAVKPFLVTHGITNATILLDPGSDAVHQLLVVGFPTTLLIGPDGKLHATLEGPAAWSTAASAIRNFVAGK